MDAIVSSINNLGNWITILIDKITSFFGSVIDIFVYILSILKAIWYGLTSLLTGLGGLIKEVLEGSVLINVGGAFGTLSEYIGGPAVIFIGSLMMIVILRIIVAFVMKFFRLNIDYNNSSSSYDRLTNHPKTLFDH